MITSISTASQSEALDSTDGGLQQPRSRPSSQAPPLLPTDPVAQKSQISQDPVALLSEAVTQLKLAVAALDRAAGAGSGASTSALQLKSSSPAMDAAGAGSIPRTQIERDIALTQDEIAAYLSSRRGGMFGENAFAAYGDASIPMSTGSLAQSTSFFGDNTSEPDL